MTKVNHKAAAEERARAAAKRHPVLVLPPHQARDWIETNVNSVAEIKEVLAVLLSDRKGAADGHHQ